MTDAAKAELDRIIMLIPRFDPHRDAAGCWFDYDAAQSALDFFPDGEGGILLWSFGISIVAALALKPVMGVTF